MLLEKVYGINYDYIGARTGSKRSPKPAKKNNW
jgi:hypothetical protein